MLLPHISLIRLFNVDSQIISGIPILITTVTSADLPRGHIRTIIHIVQ